VTQRGNRADLALSATGPVADEWLGVAQAFAGPPGPGRPPADGTVPDRTVPDDAATGDAATDEAATGEAAE
jgi:hypothetical protein